MGDKVFFFLEEPRAAQELKNLGQLSCKDGPLTVLVRPSDPPRTKGGGDSSSSRGAPSRGGPRFSNPGRRKGETDDDDIFMDEDPTQIITVSACECMQSCVY